MTIAALMLTACNPVVPSEGLASRIPAVDRLQASDDDGTTSVATPLAATRRPAWSEDRAIAITRTSLRRRGLGTIIAGGPMIAILDKAHPDAASAIDGDESLELALAWPRDASIVLTMAGRWWVWEYGAVAPADGQARQLASQAAGTRS